MPADPHDCLDSWEMGCSQTLFTCSDCFNVCSDPEMPTSAEEADARLLTAVRKPQVVDVTFQNDNTADLKIGAFGCYLLSAMTLP